jgi:hypothetical protein
VRSRLFRQPYFKLCCNTYMHARVEPRARIKYNSPQKKSESMCRFIETTDASRKKHRLLSWMSWAPIEMNEADAKSPQNPNALHQTGISALVNYTKSCICRARRSEPDPLVQIVRQSVGIRLWKEAVRWRD